MTMTPLGAGGADGLRAQGRYEEALDLLRAQFAATEAAPAPARTDLFMTMFEWQLLVEHYPPARAALAGLRRDQVERLLAGDLYVGRNEEAHALPAYQRITRFSLIVEIDELLGDPRATHALFARLDAIRPELARRYAWQALPAIVEAGDVALADRYRGDPLALLDAVNAQARLGPLFPGPGKAPRLAAELMNLVREVRIGIAVLLGQGRAAESAALREALLAGLATEELKAMAERELDQPGAITGVIVERQMAHEISQQTGQEMIQERAREAGRAGGGLGAGLSAGGRERPAARR